MEFPADRLRQQSSRLRVVICGNGESLVLLGAAEPLIDDSNQICEAATGTALGATISVAADGSVSDRNAARLTGYSIVDAADLDAAVARSVDVSSRDAEPAATRPP